MSSYESEELLGMYLQFHFGEAGQEVSSLLGISSSDVSSFLQSAANFPKNSINSLIKKELIKPSARALDVGCSVGSSSFELTKYVSEVNAFDYSKSFIDVATEIQAKGKIKGSVSIEGDIYKEEVFSLPENIKKDKVTFKVGDACNLSETGFSGKYDIVFAANLICRLPSPRVFLADIVNYLKPSGQLLFVSPYSWLTEYTDKANWLGGKNNQFTELELISILENKGLKLDFKTEIPFLIPEHKRKYQLGISQGLRFIWK